MKFDAATLQVLKNFSSINNAILFKEGNRLATISPGKTVMARATLTQEIPAKFAIYDLSRFLGTISLFDQPELTFKDGSVDISQDNNTFNYAFTDVSLIVVPPEKDIVLADAEVQFTLTTDALKKVQRALNVASLPEIAVTGKNGKILLQAVDSKGSTNDTFTIEVGETTGTFRMVIRADNIKLLEGEYEVSISSKGLSHFKGKTVEYWIAVEGNSTYQA